MKPSSHPRYEWEVVAPPGWFGRRIRRHFTDKASATAFHTDLISRIAKHGVTPVTRDEQILLARFRPLLTLAEMEAAFTRAVDARAASKLPLRDACDDFVDYVDKRHRAGTVGELYQRDAGIICGFIGKSSLGGKPLSDLTPAMVQEWVDTMTAAPVTKKNRLRILSAVLQRAVDAGRIPRNPSASVHVPKVKTAVSIITPDVMRRLMVTSLSDSSPEFRAAFWYFFFGGFMGLRRSEIERLDWSDVVVTRAELYVSPGKTPNSERWIPFTHPLRAFDWSGKPASGRVLGGIPSRTLDEARADVCHDAGVSVPMNAMRHSYGSYHLVACGDAAVTALRMGHATPQMTFAHYRRAVTEAAAEDYWGIRVTAPASPW